MTGPAPVFISPVIWSQCRPTRVTWPDGTVRDYSTRREAEEALGVKNLSSILRHTNIIDGAKVESLPMPNKQERYCINQCRRAGLTFTVYGDAAELLRRRTLRTGEDEGTLVKEILIRVLGGAR